MKKTWKVSNVTTLVIAEYTIWQCEVGNVGIGNLAMCELDVLTKYMYILVIHRDEWIGVWMCDTSLTPKLSYRYTLLQQLWICYHVLLLQCFHFPTVHLWSTASEIKLELPLNSLNTARLYKLVHNCMFCRNIS
jgi:hypothetical protein